MTSARLDRDSEDQRVCAVAGLVDLVAGTLSAARVLIRGVRHVDLRGLDRDIDALCTRILELPKDQGRDFRCPLAALLNELEALHAELAPP